ncbi:hypothetical protein LO80_03325 [Candidatus Francisella endociliophora]|uniref:Uncharacterized protein n=1 Tax=Candidatus Francisella endociliophora TaxID=653937 RepID=A0A097ENF6_9GAMM|nr:hypothetical protein [Francisella sp. FSC1006]AIT09095.1 hypothetical protein LO80_03325 [Francisella sp. FSC1006]
MIYKNKYGYDFSNLNNTEVSVYKRRLEGETLVNIANDLCKSPERIRQIYSKAQRKSKGKFLKDTSITEYHINLVENGILIPFRDAGKCIGTLSEEVIYFITNNFKKSWVEAYEMFLRSVDIDYICRQMKDPKISNRIHQVMMQKEEIQKYYSIGG